MGELEDDLKVIAIYIPCSGVRCEVQVCMVLISEVHGSDDPQ